MPLHQIQYPLIFKKRFKNKYPNVPQHTFKIYPLEKISKRALGIYIQGFSRQCTENFPLNAYKQFGFVPSVLWSTRFWFSRGFQPSKVELLQLLTGHNIKIYYLFTFIFTWAKGKKCLLTHNGVGPRIKPWLEGMMLNHQVISASFFE